MTSSRHHHLDHLIPRSMITCLFNTTRILLSIPRLCLVGRCTDIAPTSGPIDVNVLILGVLGASMLILNAECMSSKLVMSTYVQLLALLT